MKTFYTLAAAALLTLTSFAGFAATEVNAIQAAKLHSMGTISVSELNGTMEDVNTLLAKRADEKGAHYFRVIREGTAGHSDLMSGNAEIYR